MDDFEEKLNAILSSPETMAQVMSIAQSLGSSQTAPKSQEQPPPQSSFDPSHLFSQFDPAILSRVLPLLGNLNRSGSSAQEELLSALRPFLKERRQEKIDKVMQMAKLIHVGKMFMKTLGDR